MSKGSSSSTLLFAGVCALGALLFVGGYELRDRTDGTARVVREPDPFAGLVASRDQASAVPAIPLAEFYSDMTDLLKKAYVEPITDEQKLATGAVRGMVLSLGDPRCVFMDPAEFKAFVNAREGRYEGIGAEFELRGAAPTAKRVEPGTDEPVDDPREAALLGRVPYLVATMVVPGGPADRSGVKPGDIVVSVDGHWVPDAGEIARFETAVAAFGQNKIPFAQVAKLQRDLKKKLERSYLPTKAKDRLAVGSTGEVAVVWKRGGATRTTKIAKGVSTVLPFGIQNGAIALRFDAQAAGRLKAAVAGKSAVTIDLRNNVDGDFDSMRHALAAVAPNGTYGTVASRRKETPTPLVVTGGNPHPPKLTLRVDKTTRGPAAMFARALEAHHLATIIGGPTGSDLAVREVVSLPDGSGYTLVTGEFRPGEGPTKVALAEETQP